MVLLEGAEKKRSLAESEEEKCRWKVCVAYVFMSDNMSLRGNEYFLLNLDVINRHWEINDGTYLIIVLLGKSRVGIMTEHISFLALMLLAQVLMSNIP